MADAELIDPPVKRPKRGKKKLFLILGPLILVLLLAVGGVGFAFTRHLGPFAKKVVPVETPKPKVVKKSPPPDPVPVTPIPTTTTKTLPPTTTVDPDEGAAKLAKLWNELEAPQLLAIAKDWKDPELARVTSKMDPSKVAEVLAAMPAKRASALSREMQRVASIVPVN